MWILLCSLLAAPALNNPHPWEEAAKRGDIVVYTRKVEDSSIRELKAESIIAAGAERVWSVITDTAHYAEFMPYMQEARRISSDSPHVHYEYQRINPPLVKKRDYVIKTTSVPDADAGLWVHSWQSVPDVGPAPRGDTVRVTQLDGSWTVRRRDAEHTHVTYRLFTDPGGHLPRWIANRANQQSVPDLMTAVCKRALDAGYTR